MKWDGHAYADDIKYGLNLLLTDEDKEKAQSMQQKEFTDYFMNLHKNDMECFTRFPGAGSIILSCDSNGVEFNFQRILNNLGEKTITLSWSKAARFIRTWEYEKKLRILRKIYIKHSECSIQMRRMTQ